MKNQKQELTAAEIEDLKSKGYDPEEIEHAEVIVSTYEDWLDPTYTIPNFSLGISCLYRYENEVKVRLMILVLRESEWMKIEQRKQAFFDELVKGRLKMLVESFDRKYNGSREKEILVSDQLALVEQFTRGEIPRRTDGDVYSIRTDLLYLGFRNDGKNSHRLDYWYNQICVNGEDAKQYVSEHHIHTPESQWNTGNYPLGLIAWAPAFYEFKEYLKSKKGGKDLDLTQKPAMEKILTEKDCFIYETRLPGIPPSEDYLAWKKALDERIDTERKAGKFPVLANCPHCDLVIRGALKIGLTESELKVFLEKFGRHEYDNFAAGPHFDKVKDRLNSATLLDEIFDIASTFGNPELGNHFLQSVYNDLQKRGMVNWPSQIKVFNQRFKERLSERNASISAVPTPDNQTEITNLPPDFFSLFVSEQAANRALTAANKVGIISIVDEIITWSYGGKTGAILALWQAVKAKNLANPLYVTGRVACPIIAKRFGISVDRNIYDSMAAYIKPLKEEILHHL